MASISPWNDKSGRPNLKSSTVSITSFQRTAIKKLRKHQDYTSYGENQLAIVAKDLTDPDSIMNVYFGEILYKPVSLRVDEKMEESDAEFVTSDEERGSKDRSIWRVEDTAKLEVKLLLRKINAPSSGIIRTLASVFLMWYGPLHASLLINNTVLLEWNTSSLVIPERYDGTHYPIVRSALHRENSVRLAEYNPDDEIDLLFKATKSKLDILSALIKVISHYNGKFYYNARQRNCQTFVIDALKAMGCENPPKFEGNLVEYFKSLKAGRAQPEFTDHTELDEYVKANVMGSDDRLSTQDKEYLLGQYFEYHIRGLTESEHPEGWSCPIANCQMKNLEIHIDEKSMVMHRFLHIDSQ